ncbi:MAG: alpha-amylase [Frankiales bacterium]|nr:alpha-amylase [Frankiales bacterium]
MDKRGSAPSPTWSQHPAVHELNTAVWLHEVSRRAGRLVMLGDVPDHEWDAVLPAGIDVVWLMGIWERSEVGRQVALGETSLRESWTDALRDWTEADVLGSPYSIREYVPAQAFGGWDGVDAARAQVGRRGANLMVDWVPNHTGPDSPWIASSQDAFVSGTADDLAADPAAFIQLGDTVLARGRDPYFAPWPDVVQLDPFSATCRGLAVEELRRIAEHVDAVRCDMAMLMLDDIALRTWGQRLGAPPERGYWDDVIMAVRSSHPDFRFVAETYWDREPDLLAAGFDHCYDKRLYDRLTHEGPDAVRDHLRADRDYQRGMVRFLENHDEPRAASTFGPPARYKALATAIATLPGMTLWHDGQAEGRTTFLPVFLGRRPDEAPDADLASFHARLWGVAAAVRNGAWSLCEVTGWPDNGSAAALVAWQWSDSVGHTLVVVNLHGEPADGMAHLDVAAGTHGLHVDLLTGARYPFLGDAVAAQGLYIGLPGWGAQILSARREHTGGDEAASSST